MPDRMLTDAQLPVGVLDSAETERWWEECLALYEERAWAQWPLYRAEQEANRAADL